MSTTAIVLSAGKGKRMGTAVSKQYLELNGYPVLYYSLESFEKSPVDNIILVCGAGDEDFCRKNIVEKYGFKKVRAIVSGGMERYHSVYEGIKAAERFNINTDILMIHDGARPFVTVELIEKLIMCTEEEKACVAAVKAKDTVKISDKNNYIEETPDRNSVWQIQTPQSFEYNIIKSAYDNAMKNQSEGITDDAMVLEKYGDHRIKLVEASYDNIKITTPEDMIFGNAILENRNRK